LHDQFGALLTVLRLNLDLLPGLRGERRRKVLTESRALIDQAAEQVRNLSTGLWPTILDDAGLAAAVRWLAERWAKRAGFTVELDLALLTRPSPALERAAFRIVEEALTNVARHASARHVCVALRAAPDALE